MSAARVMEWPELKRKYYTPNPSLPKSKWPYRAQVAAHRVDRNLERGEPAPGACGACHGTGWETSPKNVRTGSVSYRQCGPCEGTGASHQHTTE